MPTRTSQAVAYVRRSSNHDNGTTVSYEVQRQAVLELARRNGDPDPEIIEERGRSGADARNGSWGTGRGGKRRAWGELRERIQAGEVSALYAYSLSRLEGVDERAP